MNNSVKYGLLFTGIGIAAKLVLWQLGMLTDGPTYSGMVYLFLLLTAVMVSLKLEYSGKDLRVITFKEQFKKAMQVVAIFSVFIGVFTFIYYQFLDADFFTNKINLRLEEAKKITFDAAKSNYKSKEELIAAVKSNTEMIFSPFNHATLTLFGLMIIGVVYSLVAVTLVRKNPFL